MSICSSESTLRMRGASADPASAPSTLTPATTPKCHLGTPFCAEVEGEQQREEAHDAADEAHGRRGQQHARAPQLGPLGRLGRRRW